MTGEHMLRMTAAAIVLASVVSGAMAQEQTTKDYTACVDKAAGAPIPLQACIADEQTRQTRRLQAALRGLLDAVPSQRRAQVRDAQRKWTNYRDSHCSFYDRGKVDRAGRLASSECALNFTVQRAIDLEKMKATLSAKAA